MKNQQTPKPRWLGVSLYLPLAILACGAAYAAEERGPASAPDIDPAEARAIEAYWTPERMASAIPRDIPTAVIEEGEQPLGAESYESSGGVSQPGYSLGWAPGSGPQTDPRERTTVTEDDVLWDVFMQGIMGDAVPLTWGGTDFDPDDSAGYGPFHRHTHFGRYTTYPMSTIGKLFFTLDGSNFVCSGSVIGRSTVATAGHCVSDGDGNWATNVLFCPSYRKGGPTGSGEPHPDQGCWARTSLTTSNQFHNDRNWDYDYACIVTRTTGDTVSTKIGNITGWTGRAWGGSIRFHQIASGYPAASPFPGYHIVSCNGVEWYDHQRAASSAGQKSKYIGCDMTGGSSGGPWWFGLRHPRGSFNYDDTDGSNLTAPWVGQSMLRGINSHKRCSGGCSTPPENGSGTYWQEMGSPYFQSQDAHNNSSENVFDACLSHSNN